MATDRPDISTLHEGSLLKSSSQVIVIVFRLGTGIIRKEIGQFLLIKAREAYIKVHALQGFNLDTQEFLIPSGIKSHAVVGKYVGLFLRLGHLVHEDAGNGFITFSLCRYEPSVSGDDIEILVDDDGIYKAEFPEGGAELIDLLRAVGTGVIRVRDQLVCIYQLKLGNGLVFHLHSFPGAQQPLHDIVLRRCSHKF